MSDKNKTDEVIHEGAAPEAEALGEESDVNARADSLEKMLTSANKANARLLERQRLDAKEMSTMRVAFNRNLMRILVLTEKLDEARSRLSELSHELAGKEKEIKVRAMFRDSDNRRALALEERVVSLEVAIAERLAERGEQ